MANLEDIKTILIESRQAWTAAHKELLAAVKGSSASGTKTSRQGRSGGGGDFRMPDMSGIMPEDMRQIFSGFQNTLKQIFGGTNLAKFETTLKNTMGKMVGSGTGNFFRQFSATAAGAATQLNQPIPLGSPWKDWKHLKPGDIVPGDRFHLRTKEGKATWSANLGLFQTPGLKRGKFTKDQLEQLVSGGYDVANNVFQQRDNETHKQFRKRVRNATKGIKGLTGDYDGSFTNQILKNSIWRDATPDEMADEPGRFTNLFPALGRMVDGYRRILRFTSNRIGPLFKEGIPTAWNPAVLDTLNKVPGSRLIGRAVAGTGRFGAGLSAFTNVVGTAGAGAWTAARLAGSGVLRAGAGAVGAGVRAAATTGLAAAGVAAGLTNPIGWAIAIAAAIPAIAGFTELLYKSQAGLKDFNGHMATVFARAEVNKIQRSIRSGENRATVTGWLQYQSDALKENLRPMWDQLYNILGSILAGIMAIINMLALLMKLTEYAQNPLKGVRDILGGMWDWAKGLFGAKVDLGDLGNTLREFGEGRASTYLDSSVFKWEGA
jgi:hypothetical protein